MDSEYMINFLVEDEFSSVTLVIEGRPVYAHREVLAAWSPVFKSMFTGEFREKSEKVVHLPDKKLDNFIELLHCIYPPISPITDTNVEQLLPLVEEYQMFDVKHRCEEFLLTKPGSMHLLIMAQQYHLSNLLQKCIEQVRAKSFAELQKDDYYNHLEAENLISILQLRVLDLEQAIDNDRKNFSERDGRLFGVINDLASGYGNFCADCKSRKVNDACCNCLKMFREKVKSKCEEAKIYRQTHPLPGREGLSMPRDPPTTPIKDPTHVF